MGKPKKITDEHKEMMVLLLARRFNYNQIWVMLGSENDANFYGYLPVEISRNVAWKHCKSLEKDRAGDIEKVRSANLSSLIDLRLTHKKERIIELSKIVYAKDSTKTERLQAIREIYSQCGDEVDDYMKAIAASKVSTQSDPTVIHNHYNFGDQSGNSTIGTNLEILFRKKSNRLGNPSDS